MSTVLVPSTDRHCMTWRCVEATPSISWIHHLPMIALYADLASITTNSTWKSPLATFTDSMTIPKGVTFVPSNSTSGEVLFWIYALSNHNFLNFFKNSTFVLLTPSMRICYMSYSWTLKVTISGSSCDLHALARSSFLKEIYAIFCYLIYSR